MVLVYFSYPKITFFRKQSIAYLVSTGGRLLLQEIGLGDVDWINMAEY